MVSKKEIGASLNDELNKCSMNDTSWSSLQTCIEVHTQINSNNDSSDLRRNRTVTDELDLVRLIGADVSHARKNVGGGLACTKTIKTIN